MNPLSTTTRGLAACALGLALAGGMTGVAHATGDGAVTITSQQNDAASASPRPGVVFAIGRVPGIDPTTAEGQAMYRALQEKMGEQVPVSTPVGSLAPTDAQGIASLAGLEPGVYVIHEKGVLGPDGTLVADQSGYADSLIAIPMVDDLGNPVDSIQVMPKPAGPLPLPTVTPEPLPSTTPSPSAPGPRASQPPVANPSRPATTAPATTAPAQPGPQTTRINSGGGSEFDASTQWATLVASGAVVSAAFWATRRRRHDEDED